MKYTNHYEPKVNIKEYNHNSKLFKKMMFFLIHSNIWEIRYKVANKGYALDKLINDPHIGVRKAAKKKKKEHIICV